MTAVQMAARMAVLTVGPMAVLMVELTAVPTADAGR
jgi:hypothetical protein